VMAAFAGKADYVIKRTVAHATSHRPPNRYLLRWTLGNKNTERARAFSMPYCLSN
jgi:hypothetical protein